MNIDLVVSLSQTIILLAGFIIAIRQVVLLGKQIGLGTQQLNSQLDWQRKQATFEYLNKYNNELKDCTLGLQQKIGLLKENGQQIDFDEIINLIKDDETRTQLYNLVAYFEHLAIGIDSNYFDEKLIMSAMLNSVISNFYLVKPYLLYRRNETNKNIGGNFESLVKRWEKHSYSGQFKELTSAFTGR